MRIIAINGSPRPNHNTATLLKKAAEGAASKGAEIEIINLYKLNYKGCVSCFLCKRKGSKSLYNCAVRDDITPIFEKIKNADAVIFGSPIYFYDITGETRSFLERLLFQYLPYDRDVKEGTYFSKKLRTAFIYTMGVPDGPYKDKILEKLKPMEDFISQIFRVPVKTFYSDNAYPFVDDYSNYEVSISDGENKLIHREKYFSIDCEKAFNMGVELALSES